MRGVMKHPRDNDLKDYINNIRCKDKNNSDI